MVRQLEWREVGYPPRAVSYIPPSNMIRYVAAYFVFLPVRAIENSEKEPWLSQVT